MDFDSVWNLFWNSGHGHQRGMNEDYDAFADYVTAGHITIEEQSIPKAEGEPEPHVFKHGGKEHGYMKYRAWRWLRSLGEPSPEYESWTAYGRADLQAPTLRILFECGDTGPDKPLTAFRKDACDTFCLLPFGSDTVYLMKVTPEGKRLMEEEEARKLVELGAKIRSRPAWNAI